MIEEPESQYSVDDTGFYSMGTNDSEFATNVESRNNFSKNTPNYGELQDEERSIPQVPTEMVRIFGKIGFAFLSTVANISFFIRFLRWRREMLLAKNRLSRLALTIQF